MHLGIFLAYFVHIFCIFDLYSLFFTYMYAYFVHIFYIYLYILSIFTHIFARSIPASLVAGHSCTIPASPTTTGLYALFIASKLVLIHQAHRDWPAPPGSSPLTPLLLCHISLAPAAGQNSNIGRIDLYIIYIYIYAYI